MPNGTERKEYGEHKYPNDPHHTSNCEHGCGCWAGSARSGGPLGLDPFGKCPNNPVDGKRREGNEDYHDVVEQRIRRLQSEAYSATQRAEKAEKIAGSKKKDLFDQLETANKEIRRKDEVIKSILGMASKEAREIIE